PAPVGNLPSLRVAIDSAAQMFRTCVDVAERHDVDVRAGGDGGVVRPSPAADPDRGDPEPFVGPVDARPARGRPGCGSGGHGRSVEEATTGNVCAAHEVPLAGLVGGLESGGSNTEAARASRAARSRPEGSSWFHDSRTIPALQGTQAAASTEKP